MVGEHEGPKRTSTAADHLKPWPQHRSWDYEIDLPIGDNDDHDEEDAEDSAHFRMAECGNGSSNPAQ